MFEASSISTHGVTLDFTSSGQGRRAATQLLVNGEVLANAIELSSWGEDPVQLQVCAECGTEQCAVGGWASFRRVGPNILVLPAWAEMAEQPDEYGPPPLLQARGPVLLSQQFAAELRALVPILSSARDLNCAEAVHVFQSCAPSLVLGLPPAPARLEVSRVVATDPGEPEGQIAALNELLSAMAMSREAVFVCSPATSDIVTLYLDLPGVPAWVAFSVGQRASIALAPGIFVGAA